jgi:hypothetical protein
MIRAATLEPSTLFRIECCLDIRTRTYGCRSFIGIWAVLKDGAYQWSNLGAARK